jgi:poly(3-hydroxyalkanoate) synthetase
MALTKDELQEIQDKAESIRKINITDFFTMLRDKALLWKARLS